MKAKLDKFGRIVLPKAVRDEFGLRPGDELEVEQNPDCIILKPPQDETALVRKDGLLIYTGTAEGDLNSAVVRPFNSRFKA